MVDLIEGEGRDIKGNAAEGITDGGLAPKCYAFAAENFVPGLFVDVQNDAFDARIGLQKLFYENIRVGKLLAVADEADHHLAADSAVTDKEATNKNRVWGSQFDY